MPDDEAADPHYLFTVFTPTFNRATTIGRVHASLMRQTFTDFEWVLVNDGSQDRTEEILRDLEKRDSRVRVFSPGRLGITGAANFGVNQARGEYVARQDFDDRSYPDRLRLQVAVLDANPRIGVVGGHYLVIDQNRNERYVRMPPSEHEDIIPAMARAIPMANTIAMFRKRVWTEAGGSLSKADRGEAARRPASVAATRHSCDRGRLCRSRASRRFASARSASCWKGLPAR